MTSLPRPSNLVLDHRYFLGTFKDFSGNSNDGVPTGMHFEKHPDTHVKFSGTDLITVADSTELQSTLQSIIIYGDAGFAESSGGIDFMVSKGDIGGTMYQFRIQSSNSIAFRDGTNTRTLTVNQDVNTVFLGVTFTDGGTPVGYKNGAFAGNFSGTVAIGADDADIIIGNIYSGGSPFYNPIKGVLIYDVILTAAEMAQAHAWIMEQQSQRQPKKEFRHPSLITGRENNVRSAWDLKNTHGSVIDKTGGEINGTISKCSQTKIAGLDALDFNRDNSPGISLGVGFDISGKSVSVLIKPSSFATYNTVWSSNVSGTERAGLQFIVTGFLHANVYDGSYLSMPSDSALIAGNVYHVVATYTNHSTIPTLYINGVAQSGSGTTGALNSSGHFIGTRDGNLQPYNGAIAEVIEFDSVLTQAEVTALYEKYAKLPVFVDDLSDALESVAAEGGAVGTFLSNTNWKFGDTSARYKVSRDETLNVGQKVIECTTAGLLYQESRQAYGTYEFSIYKAAASYSYILFAADTIGGATATGQDGYYILLNANERVCLKEATAGVESDKFYTVTSYFNAATWYRFRVTRRYDGQFTVYIKGGAFKTWTTVDVSGGTGTNPVTDNTTTTSKYIVLDLDAGDRVSNFKFYEGVVAP